MKTIIKRTKLLIPAVSALLIISAFGGISPDNLKDIVSDFERDADGWKGINSANQGESLSHTEGGCRSTSKGNVSVAEKKGDKKLSFFAAPSKFLGDKGWAYRGTICFSLKQSATTKTWTPYPLVVLKSKDRELHFNIVEVPSSAEWTDFYVPISEDSQWLDIKTNLKASKEDLLQVLGDLDSLWVLAEYSGNNHDRADLDDFRLISRGNPAVANTYRATPVNSNTPEAGGASGNAGGAREWTPTATGKATTGTLIKKTADNSSIVIKLTDGREVTVKTASLIQADRDYVAKWKPAMAEPRGIARGKRGGPLSQAQGGKSRVMKDLQSVLSDYGKPEEDTQPHPDALVYRGPAWFQGGGEISIPYLMPRGKALGLLVQRPGPVSRRPALAPGFPPGMVIHEYDIKVGVYNRMFILVDQADQVVALQVKAETRNNPGTPTAEWKPATMPMNSTSDFLEPRTGGAAAYVLDLRAREKRIVIDLEAGKRETLLFLPEPMIKLCLFHLSRDLRK